MDPFRGGVDGYVDVENQLYDYARRRAEEYLSREYEQKASIESVAAFEDRRERVREAFLSGIGGLPDRPDDLPVERTGVTEQDGYAVERVVFESLPDFHVTANCYVPEGAGPHPAVALFCGHVGIAKADEFTQRACIELALNGFVALAVDPLCQAERRQYPDADADEVTLNSGVYGHSRAGQKCFFAGANLARYMVNDARCAIDYLAERPGVDADRIAATGTSGGGMQTLYLSMVDDRLAAAAPCCFVCDRGEFLKTAVATDPEQNPYGAIERGINLDDFVTAMAPDPVCIGAAASDFFPIEGVREARDRARRVYDLYDAAENVEMTVADTNHASVYELGAPLAWLCETLGDGYEAHDDHAVLDPEDLRCTPSGSVHEAYDDERSVEDLLAEYVADTGADPRVDPATLRKRVVETLDLDRSESVDAVRGGTALDPRFVRDGEYEGLSVRHVFFKTERDPDVVVTGVLVSDPDVDAADSTRAPAVVCWEEGTEALPDRRADVVDLAAEYGTVFLFDPRGVGAVRSRDRPKTWVDHDHHGVQGTEFLHAHEAILLGTSLFGGRVYDVLRAAEFLRDETDGDPVALVGEGVGAYHALYAAVASENVAAVDLQDLGPNYREMATTREAPYDVRRTLYDVVGRCDVPHCLSALDDRGVSVSVERSAV